MGLLVGLQREHANSHFGGIRTFPLITVCGTLLGLLAPQLGAWPVAAGLLAVAARMAVANLLPRHQTASNDVGQTS